MFFPARSIPHFTDALAWCGSESCAYHWDLRTARHCHTSPAGGEILRDDARFSAAMQGGSAGHLEEFGRALSRELEPKKSAG